MLEIIEQPTNKDGLIYMRDMEPLQVGVVVSPTRSFDGHLVMRTADLDRFEVIDISDPRPDGCWCLQSSLEVRLLEPGESVTIRIFNE